MTIHQSAAIVALVVSSFVIGCSESAKTDGTNKTANSDKAQQHANAAGRDDIAGGDAARRHNARFNDLPVQAVLMSVNGRELTKGAFLRWVDLRKAMLSSSLGNRMSGNDLTSIVQEQMLASVTNDYANQVVASDYAKVSGVEVGTNHIETCRRAFMRTAKIDTRMPWDKAMKRFTATQRETIYDRISAEATVAAVSDDFFKKNHVEVGQDEINALYADYVAYNKKCAASNDVTWAKASNIWEQVRSGESFEKLAAKFDEDEYREEDGVWGVFRTTDFADEPEIWKLISRFRPGWVSPPIEADNGITILKVNSIEDGVANVDASDYVPSPTAEVSLSRIFIHLPLFIEEVSREQFSQECQRAKKISSFNQFLKGLVLKADIKYPYGTAIFTSQADDASPPFMAR